MGQLLALFGRSKDRRPSKADRCMECGMTDGEHTDWCPAVEEAEAEGARGPGGRRSDAPPDEAAPST